MYNNKKKTFVLQSAAVCIMKNLQKKLLVKILITIKHYNICTIYRKFLSEYFDSSVKYDGRVERRVENVILLIKLRGITVWKNPRNASTVVL
jgi:hypothetical protein